MRKIFQFLLLFSISCFSQNKQILYNFTSIPQSLLTNPGADVKYRWYAGVPLLSGISANFGSSGFTANDLFANNGIDFNTKLRNVVFSTTRRDKVYINEQLEIFNGGYKIGGWQGNTFVSFGMYQELDFLTYFPKDIAILALDGNKDYIGKVFHINDLSFRGELLSVLHFGIHKNISEKLVVGFRAKLYSSVFNVNSTKNAGYFRTIPATNTVYEQYIYSNSELNTSGFLNYTRNYSGNAKSDITKKMFFGGNLGLGFDLGLTYYPRKNLQYTASITDVGFIRHTKEVESYSFKGNYTYKGLTPIFTSGNTTIQDFKEAIPLDTLHANYTTFRPIKINSSIEYSFGKPRNSTCNCEVADAEYKSSVGAQLFIMTAPRLPFLAITGFYKRKIGGFLQLKTTYTIDSFSYKNIGLGLSSTIGSVNFYMLTDNILEYKDVSKANSLSFQLGINVVFKDNNKPNFK